jgi:hypothetical protein
LPVIVACAFASREFHAKSTLPWTTPVSARLPVTDPLALLASISPETARSWVKRAR